MDQELRGRRNRRKARRNEGWRIEQKNYEEERIELEGKKRTQDGKNSITRGKGRNETEERKPEEIMNYRKKS